MELKQGTSPPVTLTTQIKEADTASIFFTFFQKGKKILEKDISDAYWGDNYVGVTLSQEETFLFEPGLGLVQVRTKLLNGASPRTDDLYFVVTEARKKDVI